MNSITKYVIEKHGFVRRVGSGLTTVSLFLGRAVHNLFTPAGRLALIPVRTRRGAGMLEYALIALISIGVFVALNNFFPDFFQGILDNIQDQFDDTQ